MKNLGGEKIEELLPKKITAKMKENEVTFIMMKVTNNDDS